MGLGVADGVYQWREKGIDAGEFSRLLMHTALDTIEAGQPDVLKGNACDIMNTFVFLQQAYLDLAWLDNVNHRIILF